MPAICPAANDVPGDVVMRYPGVSSDGSFGSPASHSMSRAYAHVLKSPSIGATTESALMRPSGVYWISPYSASSRHELKPVYSLGSGFRRLKGCTHWPSKSQPPTVMVYGRSPSPLSIGPFCPDWSFPAMAMMTHPA